MQSVKAIRFAYEASEELATLFEEFRLMCNDAIRIALKEKPRSRFALIRLAYPRLKEYGLHTHYILSACEVAYSAFKNPKRKASPYIRRPFLKLDNQTYSLDHLILRIPTKPRHYIYLTLRASNHQLSFVDDPLLKRGSITLTDSALAIAFTKNASEMEVKGRIGIDVNERNVTWRLLRRGGEEGHIRGRGAQGAIQGDQGKDRRADVQGQATDESAPRQVWKRERDRTSQALHRMTRRIVEHAKVNGYAILMERLKGIRKLYRKGNGQGASFRGRMNSWTYHELQRQVHYKAKWDGSPVHYVNPRGTSRRCPSCGSSPLTKLEGRMLLCPSCNLCEDRDVIAAKNIMACAVPQAGPGA